MLAGCEVCIEAANLAFPFLQPISLVAARAASLLGDAVDDHLPVVQFLPADLRRPLATSSSRSPAGGSGPEYIASTVSSSTARPLPLIH
jgi:hypothetical protein